MLVVFRDLTSSLHLSPGITAPFLPQNVKSVHFFQSAHLVHPSRVSICWYVCLLVCQSVCPSHQSPLFSNRCTICLSVQTVCPSVCLCICMTVSLCPLFLSIFLSLSPIINLVVNLSDSSSAQFYVISLSICLCVRDVLKYIFAVPYQKISRFINANKPFYLLCKCCGITGH